MSPWWSFSIEMSLRVIICKRQVPTDDHFQEAGPTRWSFAICRPLQMINNNNKRRQRRRNSCGRTDGWAHQSQVVQEVLADLKRNLVASASHTSQVVESLPVKWGLYWSHFFYFRTTHFATENINEREWRIICINYINYIHNIYYIYTYHIIVIIIFFIILPSWQFACCSCKNFINWVLFLASLPRN